MLVFDYFNPKFNKLSSTAQALWHTFEYIQDYKTHQHFYALKTLCSLQGITKPTIIDAINELEAHNIISTEKSHRKSTIYTLLETVVKQKQGGFTYPLGKETLPSRVKKVYPTGSNNFTPSSMLLSSTNLSKSSLCKVNLDTKYNAEKKIKDDDFLLNLSEEKKKAYDNLCMLLDDCCVKWDNGNGLKHCERIIDNSWRIKLLGGAEKGKPYYSSGTWESYKSTILDKVDKTDNEDKIEEFVYKSLERSFAENYVPYN